MNALNDCRSSFESANLNPVNFLDQVCARSPVVKRTIDQYGQISLDNYLRETLSICKNPLQPRNDLLEAVYRYAAPLLGEAVAEKTAQELQILPAVVTAHHHGVDFQAQSVQTSLIFSLRKVGGKPAVTVPVFACGNIPLDNSTYPRGLLLYHTNQQKMGLIRHRLPIFCNKYRRKLVSIVESYNTDMVAHAKQLLADMEHNREITLELAKIVKKILQDDYLSSIALSLKSYSHQATFLNSRIWNYYFQESDHATKMVYLELEKITTFLLQADLQSEDSLAWQVMFNPILRTRVLSQLDGARACWDRGKLIKNILLDINKIRSQNGGGTIFFWAITEEGRRVPLLFKKDSSHTPVLQGRDDYGRYYTFPFCPKNILRELQKGSLIPSLFVCFLTIAFARGISCCGGYFQADYLLAMQHGLVRALSEIPGYTEIAERISQVPSNIYLSGMQAVMFSQGDDLLLPAGPVEMIASGGLSLDQLERVRSLTVRDTHLASLMDTIPDILPQQDRPDDWLLRLARENSRLLGKRIVII